MSDGAVLQVSAPLHKRGGNDRQKREEGSGAAPAPIGKPLIMGREDSGLSLPLQ